MLLFSAFQLTRHKDDPVMDLWILISSQECYLLLVSVELKTVLSASYASDTAQIKVEKRGGNQIKYIEYSNYC